MCPAEAVSVRVVLYRGAFRIWMRVGRAGQRSGVGFVKANASKRARCGRFKGVSYHTASNHLPTVTSNTHLIRCH